MVKIDPKSLYLVYINPMNTDFRRRFVYEFIFAETTDIEVGDDWTTSGISSTATPPDPSYAKYVGLLRVNEENELSLAIENEHFTMYDAIENIIALGWESEEDVDGRDRLVFQFGDTLETVKNNLLTADLSFFSSPEYMGK